jgi:hypothetical protein
VLPAYTQEKRPVEVILGSDEKMKRDEFLESLTNRPLTRIYDSVPAWEEMHRHGARDMDEC